MSASDKYQQYPGDDGWQAEIGREKDVHYLDDSDVLDAHEKNDLKRGLSQRHISMLALAGDFHSAGIHR
jgi:amino acid permease